MLLGKVIGSVVSTQKDPGVDGFKFLVVQTLDEQAKMTGVCVVAVDAVGAGEGEVILYATGSSARQTQATKDRPCDAVIMAIVDSWDVEGEVVYEKS